jgi:hypothetical protein
LLHRQYNVEQRLAFNKQIENVAPDEAIVVIDFKENIMTHKGMREISQDFRSRTPRSVLGVIIYTREKPNDPIHKQHITIISEILAKDGLYTIDNLKRIVKERLSKKQRIVFWNDCGLHFRCGEVLHYMLRELPLLQNKNVECSTFLEKHGKSSVDALFARITTWLEEAKDTLKSTKDFISYLTKRVNECVSEPNSTYIFEQYERDERPRTYKVLDGLSPKTYHTYTSERVSSNDTKICARVLTTDPQSVATVLKPKVNEKDDKRDDKKAKPKKEEDPLVMLDNLFKTQERTESAYVNEMTQTMERLTLESSSRKVLKPRPRPHTIFSPRITLIPNPDQTSTTTPDLDGIPILPPIAIAM